ncbi:DUF3794 domain-containing protein [Cytobacillus firmus]|uniref:CsxC family protein n=1 Tax=Cytobacillus firmus TaxID=1399 RepID=UPI001C9660DA|nr:DUF3794 domain-containing protein [Cytobacillus firmus]MBY6053345.1 DUF3794 domain-containing protein [Cytobacillus firmus]USK41241.1 DUF3794 domain-containing protein [Cytobacillus firmus]
MKKDNKCVDLNLSANVGECDYSPSAAPITPAGETIIRVPVELAVLTVRTNLSAKITFPEPVLEIKDVKKRVQIIQCKLLLPGVAPGVDPFPAASYNLFLKGFVRKNIQYATPCYNSGVCVNSEMRSFTTEVPFECIVPIAAGDFINPPQLPFLNARAEFDFFRQQELGHGYPEKDHFLSSDLSQFHQISSQFYNQMPYCELISSNITEWDEALDRKPFHHSANWSEGTFESISEKMFLQFTVKVLQNQQVRVTAL